MNREESKKEKKEEEKKTVKSKLGKEAKIGVSVILLLLLILGGVVVMKVMGGGSDDKVAADQDAGKGKHVGPGANEQHKAGNLNFPPSNKEPIYVPANAASSKRSFPPSDRDDSKREIGYGTPRGSSNVFGGDASKPYSAGRSETPRDNPFAEHKPQNKNTSEFGIVVTDEKPNHGKPRDEFGFGGAEGRKAEGFAKVDSAAPGSHDRFMPDSPKPFPNDRSERKDNAFGDHKPQNKNVSEFGIEVIDEKPKHHNPHEEFGRADERRERGEDLTKIEPAPNPWDESTPKTKSHILPPPPDEQVSWTKSNDAAAIRRNCMPSTTFATKKTGRPTATICPNGTTANMRSSRATHFGRSQRNSTGRARISRPWSKKIAPRASTKTISSPAS